MAYSSDLRTRVLQFIANGGSKTEAAKRFKVGRTAIYRWLNAKDPLMCGKPGPRKPRLLDPTALAEHVKTHPDQTLKERAKHFGVSPACVGYGLKRLGYTRKKKRLDIRSNVQKNVKPISSNSQRQKHRAKRWFTSTRPVLQMKPSEVMAMPYGDNVSTDWYRAKKTALLLW